MPDRTLSDITRTLLNQAASKEQLQNALDHFSALCSDISGIVPDPTYSSWAGDTFLNDGVAINPRAAAHCIKDYQRSIVFIRAVYTAIKVSESKNQGKPVNILYAGCGPFATLLLPLLTQFQTGILNIQLLDIHQHSLNSVTKLLTHFGLDDHNVKFTQEDACTYLHPHQLDVIIAETMQKSLEQEPQFAVTANLAPQLTDQGIFIPQKIVVSLCLAHLSDERQVFETTGHINHLARVKSGKRHPLGTLLTLSAQTAPLQQKNAIGLGSQRASLPEVKVSIPDIAHLGSYDALMLTTIHVFEDYYLHDYEAAITLPYQCHELCPLKSGNTYQVSYQLGKYPRFNITPVAKTS